MSFSALGVCKKHLFICLLWILDRADLVWGPLSILRAAAGPGGKAGSRGGGVPALLVPGVVPLDEALGALQLGVQAVLLAPVPGHTLGGDAAVEQDGIEG